ncbi:MAG TPA: hypothetical protein DCG75_09255 [Bacteroidales bacterium]|nr:hypothetical protein [Bacteroidales bacterium]
MKSLSKLLFKIILGLFILLTIPNYYSVIYKFNKGHKFEGEQFYNPYANINGTWIKANLHAHARAYAGASKGENTAKEMLHKYDSLKYYLACISNYNFVQDSIPGHNYLPVYEHGFNWLWVHQNVINETQARPFDFPFLQLRSNKQFMINRLKSKDNLISLNHPNHKRAYKNSDLKYLNNYDLIEGISEFAKSIKQWDSVLSHGHAVWIVGNDDSHDLSDYHVGICWNMIHVDTINNESILQSLQKGASYATKGWLGQEMNRVKAVKVEDGFFKLKLRNKADSITLISDNGVIVAMASKVDTLSYKIKTENTYLRTEIFETEPWNGYTKMYLNPVIRTNSEKLIQHNNTNEISYFLSGLYWSVLFLLHAVIILLIFKW